MPEVKLRPNSQCCFRRSLGLRLAVDLPYVAKKICSWTHSCLARSLSTLHHSRKPWTLHTRAPQPELKSRLAGLWNSISWGLPASTPLSPWSQLQTESPCVDAGALGPSLSWGLHRSESYPPVGRSTGRLTAWTWFRTFRIRFFSLRLKCPGPGKKHAKQATSCKGQNKQQAVKDCPQPLTLFCMLVFLGRANTPSPEGARGAIKSKSHKDCGLCDRDRGFRAPKNSNMVLAWYKR